MFNVGDRVQVRVIDTVLEGVVTDDGRMSDGMESCLMRVQPDGWDRDQSYLRRQVYPLTPEAHRQIIHDAVKALEGVRRAADVVRRELIGVSLNQNGAQPCVEAIDPT